VLASSWSLLLPAEQHFAVQVSILVADVPLSTLEAIVVPLPTAWRPVVNLVAALRARSFLTARTERDVRLFGLYDLVRRFLLERLAERGEAAVRAHRAHVTAHFLAVASDALDQWWRSGEDESLTCLLDLEPHLLHIAQTAPEVQHRAEAMLALEPVFANGGGAAERWRLPLLRMLDDAALTPALRDRLTLTLGWLEMNAGERESSQRLVDARVPPTDEDDRTAARWAFLTGRLQHLAGRTEPALSAYAAAAERAGVAGDAAIEADVTAAQVILLVLPLRLTEAGALCRRAARLPVGPRFRAMLEARTGNVAAAGMENERALACFRRALLQLGEGPHPLARLTIETYAGAVQRELGQADAVVALWTARLPAMRDLGNPTALCAALCQYGRGLLLLDRTDEAAPLFAESLALGHAMGFRGAIAEAQMDHGHLAFSRGAHTEARAAFERAAATFGDWLPASARQARFLAAFVAALVDPATPLPELANTSGAATVDLEAIAPAMRTWVIEAPEAARQCLRGLRDAPGWRFHFWRRALERRLSVA
jgi:tetratricopeptide (TPR) repeat protein